MPDISDAQQASWWEGTDGRTLAIEVIAGRPILDDEDGQVRRILRALSNQASDVEEPLSYFSFDYALPEVSGRTHETYEQFRALAQRPWARLVVDAIAERLRVATFRVDGFDAYGLWRASEMDAGQNLAHREQVAAGKVFLLVWPDEDGQVRISVESAKEAVVRRDRSGRPIEAGKVSLDEDGAPRVDVWTRDTWSVWRTDESASWYLDARTSNPAGMIPLIAMPYRPSLDSPEGRSELSDLIPIFRSIDRITLEMLLAAHVGAYPQRWAAGLEVDDSAPNPWRSMVEHVWTSESPDTKFGAFPAIDAKQYVTLIDSDVANMSAISRVPAQYLISSSLANPPSEGSVKTQEGPLLAKLRDIAAQNGRAYEDAMRVAAALAGRRDLGQVEVVWQPFSTDSDSEMADAAIKWSQLHPDMPIEWVLRRSGMDETTIAEFTRAKMARSLLEGDATDPAVATAVEMVKTTPALLTGGMTVADLAEQLRTAGL